MTGGIGDPLIQQGTRPSTPVPVAAPLGTPNGAKGRIVLAKPALTGNALEDVQYQGWLYAAVIAAPGNNVFSTKEQFDGLYMTKDFGQNWVKVTLPTTPACRRTTSHRRQRQPAHRQHDPRRHAARPGELRPLADGRPQRPERRLRRRHGSSSAPPA